MGPAKRAKGEERCGLGGPCHIARPDIGRGRDALQMERIYPRRFGYPAVMAPRPRRRTVRARRCGYDYTYFASFLRRFISRAKACLASSTKLRRPSALTQLPPNAIAVCCSMRSDVATVIE